MKNFGILIICLATYIYPFRGFAKPKDLKTLETDKKKLIQEISKVQKLISTKEQNYKKTLNQINVLTKQVDKVVAIVAKIDGSLKDIKKQIDKRSLIITKLHKDISRFKKEYADALWSAYKTKIALDNIPYIIYPNSYQERSKKFSSFKFYIKHRTKHIISIENNFKKLSLEKNRFEEHRKIQHALLESRKREMRDLESLRKTHSKLSDKLQGEKLALTKELENKKQNIATLNASINKIIQENIAKQQAAKKAEEERKARENAHSEQKNSLKQLSSVEYEQEQKLAKNFSLSKGQIPWPVSKGLVTGKFGIHTHPTFKDVQINNLGINIQTQRGSLVQAVFAGKVVSVMRMPGMQNVVVLAHGDYHTVYVMLSEVNVKEGSDIKCGDTIGKSNEEIQFQIWDHGVKVDPEIWLKK